MLPLPIASIDCIDANVRPTPTLQPPTSPRYIVGSAADRCRASEETISICTQRTLQEIIGCHRTVHYRNAQRVRRFDDPIPKYSPRQYSKPSNRPAPSACIPMPFGKLKQSHGPTVLTQDTHYTKLRRVARAKAQIACIFRKRLVFSLCSRHSIHHITASHWPPNPCIVPGKRRHAWAALFQMNRRFAMKSWHNTESNGNLYANDTSASSL